MLRTLTDLFGFTELKHEPGQLRFMYRKDKPLVESFVNVQDLYVGLDQMEARGYDRLTLTALRKVIEDSWALS